MTTATTAGTRLIDVLTPLFAVRLRQLAVELDLDRALAGGPRPVAALAADHGLDADALRRALRGLACLGELAEPAPGVFAVADPSTRPVSITPPAAPATTPSRSPSTAAWQQTMADSGRAAGFARVFGAEGLWHSLRTGEPAFRHVFGAGAFDFFAADPEASAGLHGMTAHSTDVHAAAIVAGYPFGRAGSVTDLGGGNGALALQILRTHPGVQVAVLDQAAGAAVASARLAAEPGLTGRWQVFAGDFFDAVPPGADVYLVKSVLHDWDDAGCVRILANCRRVMRPGARVLVVERLLPPTARPGAADFDLVVSDLVCLLLSDGGRERDVAGYRALFTAAGLEPVGDPVACPPSPFHLLEAVVPG